ncbi:MAG TPA: HAD family phosphatase [Agriterribacter sp.]|nr:HAD family phosphatase [Chitinophagaceae bacterium]HRP31031.1 HAD family phosphatase [Agriterribacter sp.]
MQNIENLIFDLGGVILTLDMPRAEQQFTALGVKDYNALFRSGNVSSFFKEYEVGAISDAEFLSNLRQLAGVPLSDQQLIGAWNAMLGYFPEERIALLNQLKNKYRLFLFSNTNALHLTTFRKMYADAFNGNVFDGHFEKAYYSHSLGMRKPDKESYEYIITENNLVPSKTVFIDDSILNIEGAEAAGLRGIHIKPGMSILDIGL